MDLKRFPDTQKEISQMLSLGFLIDNYLLDIEKQGYYLSSDLDINNFIKNILNQIASKTLARIDELKEPRY